MKLHAIVPVLLAGALSAALAGEVGSAIDVATQAKDTRNQTWASAAWCEGAKTWLVVWREGYLNEQKSDIWCARISADGKALDPAGVKLTDGEAFRDRPRVASDGKKFLVVWEEVPPGKDWDVFGALVPPEGAAPGGKPFLVAGGGHSQCRPDVAFAKGNYHVLWMGYESTYGIYGTRVSPDGKPLGGSPATVATIAPTKPNNPVNVTLPAIAANAEGDLLSAFHVRDCYRVTYVARRPLDAATGQPGGAAPSGSGDKSSPGGKGWGGRERTLALAMGPDGAISVSSVETTRSKNDIIIGRLSKTGDVQGTQEAGAASLGISDPFKPIAARFAVAFSGQAYLAVGEVLGVAEGAKRPGADDLFARVIAWRIKPDGSADGEAFAVAGEAGKECMLPSVASGPDGSCLAIYSELRGVDDVKVVAKVVK